MNSLNILLVFTIASLGLAILFFSLPQIIAPIPYGTFTFLFVFLTCVFVAKRLGRPREFINESQQSLVNTLRAYFWVMSAFFFFDGIAHVGVPKLYPVDIVASHVHTFAHVFFFAGNAILMRIPVSFINSRLKNYASGLMALLGIIAVAWRVIHTDKLVYIFGPLEPPIVITDKFSGILFLVTNVIALLLPGLYLIYMGFRNQERLVKMRAIFLGLGMAVFFSVGPVIDLLASQYTQLLIHELITLSFFFMGASAFYGAENLAKKNIENKNF